MAIGLGLVVVMPTSASDAWLFTAMVLAGIGFGFFQTPNNRVMLGSAPRNRAGAVGGLQATTRVFSQTFGAAIVAVVFSFGFSGGPMLGLCVAIGFALIAVGVNTLRYFQAPRSRADG
jgi:DHA2 family multidrug resistance protein-like MFS transporter